MSGGYDYEAIEDVKNDLCCVICLNLMKDAMQLGCEHRMCNFCLQSLANSSRQRNVEFVCPSCQVPVDEEKVHPAGMVNRIILSLKVKCVNSKAGCNWIGEISNVKDHRNNFCDYQDLPCDFFGCNFHIRRMDMTVHKTFCNFRIVLCDYCQENCIYKDLPIHLRTCHLYPVICLNECGELIPRGEIQNHLQTTCLHRVIDCTFRSIGCMTKMTVDKKSEHLSSSLTEHLILVAKDSADMRFTLKQTQNDLVAVKKELTSTKEELTVAKEELAMMNKNINIPHLNPDVNKTQIYESIMAEIDEKYNRFDTLITENREIICKRNCFKPLTCDLYKERLHQEFSEIIAPYGQYSFTLDLIQSYEDTCHSMQLSQHFWDVWKGSVKKNILFQTSFEHINKFHTLKKHVNTIVDEWHYLLLDEVKKRPFLLIDGCYYVVLNFCSTSAKVVQLPVGLIRFVVTRNKGMPLMVCVDKVVGQFIISTVSEIGGKEILAEKGCFPCEVKNKLAYNTYLVKIQYIENNNA